MARVVACLALIAPAAGLVAPAAPAASTALKAEAAASLKGMSGGVQAGDPMPGEGPWDPIGFSKLHENIQGSEHAGVVPSPAGHQVGPDLPSVRQALRPPWLHRSGSAAPQALRTRAVARDPRPHAAASPRALARLRVVMVNPAKLRGDLASLQIMMVQAVKLSLR